MDPYKNILLKKLIAAGFGWKITSNLVSACAVGRGGAEKQKITKSAVTKYKHNIKSDSNGIRTRNHLVRKRTLTVAK